MSLSKRFNIQPKATSVSTEEISNEGFIDNVKNFFSRLFITNKEISRGLQILKNRPNREQVTLPDVPWARVFNSGKNHINGDTMLETLNKFNTTKEDLIKETSTIVDKISEAVMVSFNFRLDAANRKMSIIKLTREVEDVGFKMQQYYPSFTYSRDKVSVETGNEKQVEQLISWLESRFVNNKSLRDFHLLKNKVDQAMERVSTHYVETTFELDSETGLYQKNEQEISYIEDEDLERIFYAAKDTLDIISRTINSYEINFDRLVHGSYMFIKESKVPQQN